MIYIYFILFLKIKNFYHGTSVSAGSPKAMCVFQRKEFTPQLIRGSVLQLPFLFSNSVMQINR